MRHDRTKAKSLVERGAEDSKPVSSILVLVLIFNFVQKAVYLDHSYNSDTTKNTNNMQSVAQENIMMQNMVETSSDSIFTYNEDEDSEYSDCSPLTYF